MERVTYKINEVLRGDFLYNLKFYCPFITNIETSGENIILTIEADSAESMQKFKTVAHDVYEKISQKKAIKKRELYRNDCSMQHSADINQELISRGFIIEYSPGIIGFKGLYLALYKAFDHLFADIAATLHAEETHFPALLPIKEMDRCNYINNFAHHLTYAAHLQEDMHRIQNYVKNREQGDMSPHWCPAEIALCDGKHTNRFQFKKVSFP